MLDSGLEMQPKILVIGSKDHGRANCVDWLQPFPNIEDYDYIILNLQSLTQKVYDKIEARISRMEESITTIFNTDREIFCIMKEVIHPSPTPTPPGTGKGLVVVDYVRPSNYDWLPATIKTRKRKEGSSIYVANNRFERYFQCVDKWNLEISLSFERLQDILTSVQLQFVPIARNKSRKIIAGTLKYSEIFHAKKDGAIHLLPRPTRCDADQAIEILLDLICGEEKKFVPPWRKDIGVPKIAEFEADIKDKVENIKRIQQEISQLRSQMQEWDSYRDLLTETGDELERIVHKALSDIGIKTRKTEEGFPADLISNKVAIEVTGIKGCVGVSSEKVNQTGRFKEFHDKGQKVILIANTNLVLSPKNREGEMDFSPQVEKYFESLSVCCLTTKTLFQLWKDVVTGERTSKDVKRAIFSKNGELTLSDFE